MEAFSQRFIIFSFIAVAAYIVVRAFSVKRTTARGGHWWRLWMVAAAALIFLVRRGGTAAPRVLQSTLWARSFPVMLTTDVLVLLGVVVVVWARSTLGRNWSANVVLKEDHEIIARGPYAYVRHPMYSGTLLMMVGAVMFFANAAVCLVAVLFALGLVFKAREEEKLLARRLPETYPAYKARTKMLIPFVL